MGKRIIIFKQHFYKYINKAEYAMALSAIAGCFTTTIIQSYSSYLSDRNARIERINKKPLNYIYVDYISNETYEKIINKNNWKPASSRIQQEQTEKQAQNNKTKKQELIDSINNWLKAKTAKQQQNNNEIDEETLKQLEMMNKRAIETYNNQQSILKEEKVDYLQNSNNVSSEKNENKQGILPPDRNKKQKDINYFVVQYDDSIRYDPRKYREEHKKQNITTEQNKKIVGNIGGQQIKKDKNIFESFINIFKSIVFKKDKYSKKGTIVNTKYDQNGEKIKTNNINQKQTTSQLIQNNVKQKNIEKNDNEKYQETIKEIENQKLKEKQLDLNKYLKPIFIIDGKLQKLKNYNNFKTLSDKSNINYKDIQMMSYLEYTIEKCWYEQYNKKYNKNVIDSNFSILYKQNTEIQTIKLSYINKQNNESFRKTFIKDVVNMIKTCDISKTKYLSSKNYELWKNIIVKFKNNNTI